MSQQFSLSFDRPRSRRTDPKSSSRAEDSMRRSGALRGQRAIALQLVKDFPGRTSLELAKMGTLDRYQLARRLSDLFHMKLVTRVESGAEDVRWWAVEGK